MHSVHAYSLCICSENWCMGYGMKLMCVGWAVGCMSAARVSRGCETTSYFVWASRTGGAGTVAAVPVTLLCVCAIRLLVWVQCHRAFCEYSTFAWVVD
jgi:hypothetical protein